MKMFVSFLAGLIVGVAVHWYFSKPESDAVVADAKETIRESARDVGQSIKETFTSEEVKDQLARTGQVIREKGKQAGNTIADATANASVSTAIKAKLLQDSGLSAFKIDVDTTDGVVTLSGTVSSHEEIARAVNLAWDTDGVHKVISTIQVKP